MIKRILVLLTAVFLIDLFLLLKIGQKYGLVTILILTVGFGIAGVLLVKKQGFNILHRIKTNISSGQLPGDSILDGILVLAGGILMLIPGVITALAGLVLVIPIYRNAFRRLIKAWLIKQLHLGYWHIQFRDH